MSQMVQRPPRRRRRVRPQADGSLRVFGYVRSPDPSERARQRQAIEDEARVMSWQLVGVIEDDAALPLCEFDLDWRRSFSPIVAEMLNDLDQRGDRLAVAGLRDIADPSDDEFSAYNLLTLRDVSPDRWDTYSVQHHRALDAAGYLIVVLAECFADYSRVVGEQPPTELVALATAVTARATR